MKKKIKNYNDLYFKLNKIFMHRFGNPAQGHISHDVFKNDYKIKTLNLLKHYKNH